MDGENQPNCVEKTHFYEIFLFFLNLIEMDGQNRVITFISVQK